MKVSRKRFKVDLAAVLPIAVMFLVLGCRKEVDSSQQSPMVAVEPDESDPVVPEVPQPPATVPPKTSPNSSLGELTQSAQEADPMSNAGAIPGDSSTEATTQTRESDRLTVAVLEFEDISTTNQFFGLGRSLQSFLTTDLSVSRDLLLVERARLDSVLAEIDLGKTGFLDTATAASFGRGVGAKAVLTGSFWIKDDAIRIDARLVHVETGQVILAEEITGKPQEFTSLEKKLATKVIESTGIRLSAFENADFARQHTSNLMAASRYGAALAAEDAGKLIEARRNSEAAIEIDPNFALAKELQSELAKLIQSANDQEFERKAIFLAEFEDSLNGWAFDHPKYSPDNYLKLLNEHGPKRALFNWLSRLGPGAKRMNSATPPEALFTTSGEGRTTYSQLYLEMGAADPVLFWCDVMTSDPKYSPHLPLTREMVEFNHLAAPLFGPYAPRYFARLPDIEEKRFQAQAWINDDYDAALQTMTKAHRNLEVLNPSNGFVTMLERLNTVVNDPEEFEAKRNESRRKRFLWTIARDHIITFHYTRQRSRFDNKNEPSEPPDAAAEREQLIVDYTPRIPVTMGGLAERLRAAKQFQASLLDDADGAMFVARPTLVATEGREAMSIMVVHLAGCPESSIGLKERVALNLPLPGVMGMQRKSVFEKAESADDALNKGWCPCETCRPFRWASSERVRSHFVANLPSLCERFVEESSPKIAFELRSLATSLSDAPTPQLRTDLKKACLHACRSSTGDRKLHAILLQAYGKIVAVEDCPWLGDVLASSQWWDVRINTAATLACLGNKFADDALSNSIEREPFYFVRNCLEAARARNRTKAMLRRLDSYEGAIASQDYPRARQILESNFKQATGDMNLPGPLREHWELSFEILLSQLCEHEGKGSDSIKHLRRTVELDRKNVSHRNNLGYNIAVYGGDLDEAERILREGIELDQSQVALSNGDRSQDALILDSLGFVLLKKGSFREAKSFVLKSLESPEAQLTESYDHLGDIHLALGEISEAVVAWRRAIEVAVDTAKDRMQVESVKEKLTRHEK